MAQFRQFSAVIINSAILIPERTGNPRVRDESSP
jgi:hypothetical protein